MRVLRWNCRGLGRPRTVRALKEAFREHHPQVVGLIETKKGDGDWEWLKRSLGFRNCFTVSCRGKSGGLALLWTDDLDVTIRSYSGSHVDAEVKSLTHFRVSLFYGDPVASKRKLSWKLLRQLREASDLPWVVIGDFNEVICSEEARGMRSRQVWQMANFREALNDCGLSDLGFRGFPYTFTNRREGDMEFRARLDRAVADVDWRRLHPNSMISHLHLHASDHQAILLDTEGSVTGKRKRFFRFEAMWMDHPDLEKTLRDFWQSHGINGSCWALNLRNCQKMLQDWNINVFGNVRRRIRDIKRRLEEAKCAPCNSTNKEEEAKLSEELDNWLAREETLWLQRSRVLWMHQGDKNTKFFHARASHRRKKNWVHALIDEHGVKQTDQGEMMKVAVAYFQKIFQAKVDMRTMNWEAHLQHVVPTVDEVMNASLIEEISEVEIRRAVFAQGPLKAPGLDGFPGIFYQKYWSIFKDQIVSFIKKFWEDGSLDWEINKTLIALIPKKSEAVRMEDWRPISLCNVAVKIITKILASRLQPILDRVISIYQSAFVKGRSITDNFIIAHEVSHYLRSCKGSSNYYASIKVDMSKAYDRVEWSFLEALMRRMGFADKWMDRVMSCVRSVSYVVKLNDHISNVIRPSRGLRQGDPLSPYLFLFCAEMLSAEVTAGFAVGKLSGVRVSRRAPAITHLFFADDAIFFVRANAEEVSNLKEVLKHYEEISGQMINFEKSEVSFSRNTPAAVREEIIRVLGMQQVPSHSKYLGLPLVMGQKKTETFRGILEKMWKRVSDWKSKLLSVAGREVLIKSVLQTLPVYTMSVYKIPVKLLQDMAKLIFKFWWDKKSNRSSSWVNKEILMKKKLDGGLGFKDLGCFNEAFLMKICWRIVKLPNLLMSRVLVAKYYPDGSLWSARVGLRPSHAWRGVMKVMDIFREAIWWDIGRGTVVWKYSSNGLFSVKSAYERLKQLEVAKSNSVGEQSDSSGIVRFWKIL
ncbi:unnamed protein product [Rhodiola kirilowii]